MTEPFTYSCAFARNRAMYRDFTATDDADLYNQILNHTRTAYPDRAVELELMTDQLDVYLVDRDSNHRRRVATYMIA